MKSRLLLSSLLIAVTVHSATAAAEERGMTTKMFKMWGQITDSVKEKVQEWWEYWTPGEGGQPVAKPTPNQPNPANGAPASSGLAPTGQAQMVPPVGNKAPTARPVPQETLEQAKLRTQPIFDKQTENSSVDDIKRVKEGIKQTSVLSVVKQGFLGSSKLPTSKAGVPVSNFKEIQVTKKVPALDIGTESEIAAKDFSFGDLIWNEQTGSQFERLPSPTPFSTPEMRQALSLKVKPAGEPRGPDSKLKLDGRLITPESVAGIDWQLSVGEDSTPKPYEKLSDDQLKMVAALILFNRGNSCHYVMGMFHQLSQKSATKVEANYHLGACADELKMNQAAFDRLSKVVRSLDSDYAAPALELLAKDLPSIYEQDFYKLAKSIPQFKSLITEKTRDVVTYRMAKGAFRLGDYKTSSVYADQVSEKSNLYNDAHFLSAMNSFATGDKKRALKKLTDLWKRVESKGDSNMKALVAVNLARMHFSQKQYDKAHSFYLKVPKDHAFWVQALIEQGWAQIALKDYAGAIGNMYSLHSPYFKTVYQPESFVVRTIGYLNICQYGDAYKTLSWLEKDYRGWFVKTDGYLNTKPNALTVYGSVRNYLRGKSTDDVDGVPFQVWREMARRKDFLNVQAALNDKLDESRRYEGVNDKIKAEKASIRARTEAAKRRFDELGHKIASASTNQALAKDVPQWKASQKLEKDVVIALRYQLAVLEQGRQAYLEFQKDSQSRLNQETANLSQRAGEILLSRAKKIREEMLRVLDNNELLRYEVFAGSGENIRYQVAGGEVGAQHRIPASVRPQKSLNWSFDGEFWEDEIGSYRSSLQNNCPRRAGETAKLDN
ncbi:MAG: tetratricopeptide repeat protein [Bdellovibrionales bacterium]